MMASLIKFSSFSSTKINECRIFFNFLDNKSVFDDFLLGFYKFKFVFLDFLRVKNIFSAPNDFVFNFFVLFYKEKIVFPAIKLSVWTRRRFFINWRAGEVSAKYFNICLARGWSRFVSKKLFENKTRNGGKRRKEKREKGFFGFGKLHGKKNIRWTVACFSWFLWINLLRFEWELNFGTYISNFLNF